MNDEYVTKTALPAPLRRWWLKTRECKAGIQLDGQGMPACVEYFVPWWAWPFELIHRAIFGHVRLEAKPAMAGQGAG